jgi:PleD family two-component response regulator
MESRGGAGGGQGAQPRKAVTVAHGEARIAVGASVGLVLLVAGAVPEQMIDAADKAMYARKNERRGVPR